MIVMQKWIHELTLMQQTVLMTSVRGPDGVAKYHSCKFLLRWYRRCTLLNSLTKKVMTTPYEFGGGSFTGPSYTPTTTKHDWEPRMNDLLADYLKSLDELPHHFQLHFMHAAEIIGYKHTDHKIRGWWQMVYFELVHDMHLNPETEEQLDYRLADDEAQWRRSSHPATQT